MKKTFIKTVFMAAALALASCGGDKIPPDVMDEKAMADFLNEAYLIESFYAIESGFNYSNLSGEIAAAYDSLLDAHGITRADFERSIDYYSRHADRYERIHRKVVAHLDSVANSR
ncbi:MAG: DUF4296 domain-containing protein [Bacteroidales bacterium]|nr:DUF4296 domain-containing protein [Bacteroidales bacterium]